MTGTDAFDGQLDDWEDVQDAASWDALIVGNGLSINVWPAFAYGSLFEQARNGGQFEPDDDAIFRSLGVENFEHVLHALTDSIAIGEALGKRRRAERERHRSIKAALAKAVRDVHVPGGLVPLETFTRIRDQLRWHRRVFSTSYDLLIYWAAAKGEPPFEGFVDFLWGPFDESTITLDDESPVTRLYFLHGALHLVLADGQTCKRRAGMMASLLDQFDQPFEGDDTANPLIITEGRASEKARNIADNAYLTFCWRELSQCDAPCVIFGHSLSEQDTHLVTALNEHPERAIAVGLRDRGVRENRREQHRICSLLDTTECYFFDASTYPLGDATLALQPADAV